MASDFCLLLFITLILTFANGVETKGSRGGRRFLPSVSELDDSLATCPLRQPSTQGVINVTAKGFETYALVIFHTIYPAQLLLFRVESVQNPSLFVESYCNEVNVTGIPLGSAHSFAVSVANSPAASPISFSNIVTADNTPSRPRDAWYRVDTDDDLNQILHIYWQASFHRSETVNYYRLRFDAWEAVSEIVPLKNVETETFNATFDLSTVVGTVDEIHVNITSVNTNGESYFTPINVSGDFNTSLFVESGETRTLVAGDNIGAILWIKPGGKAIVPPSVKTLNFPKAVYIGGTLEVEEARFFSNNIQIGQSGSVSATTLISLNSTG
jgi:hypothetical protein